MPKTYFVTGTDTDVGKTVVCAGLLQAANHLGLRTLAIKPVAAGCIRTKSGLRNADALALQEAMSVKLPYEQVNPVALEEALAPHIAAERAGVRMNVQRLAGICRGTLMQRADLSMLEGAGGWRVPLNGREFLSSLAVELQLPVILVVGMRLGCLNHAVLTAEAIVRDGLVLAGWVANRCVAQMEGYAENVATLRAMLRAPCLGEVPFLAEPTGAAAAAYLNCGPLISDSAD